MKRESEKYAAALCEKLVKLTEEVVSLRAANEFLKMENRRLQQNDLRPAPPLRIGSHHICQVCGGWHANGVMCPSLIPTCQS